MTVSWMGDVFVGAETGLLKSVQLHNQNWSNLGGKPSEAKRENEIVRMCWGNEDETTVILGLRSNDVVKVCLSSQTSSLLFSGASLDLGVEGKFVGLESLQGGTNIMAAQQKGAWAIYNADHMGNWGCSLLTSMSLKKHQDCRRMRSNVSSRGVVVGTGGLNEHLKLWDVTRASTETAKPFFTARNVKNDWLNLQVRTCIQDLRFIPESDHVVTCTGYHQVRLYDPKTQRRPVVDFESGEFPLTCIDVVPRNHNHVIVGNTRGVMSQHDLRMKGRLVHGFRGFAGGIRDLRCHASEPLVASVGLDRFLRVHNVVNHRQVNKVYLKSRLNQCLFKTTLNQGLDLEGEGEGDDDEKKKTKKEGEERGKEEEKMEEDEIWEKMETVGRKEERERGTTTAEEKGGGEAALGEVSQKRKATTVTIIEDEDQVGREEKGGDAAAGEVGRKRKATTVTIIEDDDQVGREKKGGDDAAAGEVGRKKKATTVTIIEDNDQVGREEKGGEATAGEVSQKRKATTVTIIEDDDDQVGRKRKKKMKS